MTEVDQISYIFGSFSRRRQSQEVISKRRSIVTAPKISHERSNSAPHSSKFHNSQTSFNSLSLANFNQDERRFKCPICQKCFIDPRVLPCLHTLCSRCLQDIEATFAWKKNGSDGSLNSTKHDSGSGGSGYDSDKKNATYESSQQNGFSCPVCGVWVTLSSQGILGLPPHYLLQHRMVLATLNASTTRLLCDTCTGDVAAAFRCTECALSLCQPCTIAHTRPRDSSHHEVLRLEEARRRGITRVRRQIMCYHHPDKELSAFCTVCCEVICRECVSTNHKNHTCEAASRAAKTFTTNMRETLERVRYFSKQANVISTRLQNDSKRVQNGCNQVQEEIDQFMDSYLTAIEEHRKRLNQQITEARLQKMQHIEERQLEVQKRLRNVKDVVAFADELLNEGTDVEVLSFVKPIFDQLGKCNKLEPLPDVQISESLQFLPNELSQTNEFHTLYGVITTQTVSPRHCILNQEGLQNLRVGRKTETLLHTRDSNDTPLQRGGETFTVDLRHRDAGVSRSLLVRVEDKRDGTYNLSFTPDVAGKLLLYISVKGQQIKESPFPIIVRTLRPHQGTFHCCCFCSSGGSKEVGCGCGGKMPGGYRGCGHGHDGHPGRRHWSCCGNVLEHSECIRANSTHYQFTL